MDVALGNPLLITRSTQWVAILALVISTTVQTQDLGDVEGDVERGRRTMPIALGDKPTRWLTVFFILTFSMFCLIYWSLDWYICALYLLLGATISFRVLIYRNASADRNTFKFWNV